MDQSLGYKLRSRTVAMFSLCWAIGLGDGLPPKGFCLEVSHFSLCTLLAQILPKNRLGQGRKED